MFALLEDAGFTAVKSAVVPNFRFKKASTQKAAEAYGVKAVMMTAVKREPPAQADASSSR